MSDGVHRLGADTVALLLELLELQEPVLSGAAAEMMPSAVIDGLLAARLLVEHGHELVSASLADHDDVPVSLIPSADGREHGYFSPAVGWVAVPNARLKLYRVDVGAVLRMLAAHLNLPRGWSPEPLAAGAVWELGEARIGNRTLRIPIWFARRGFDAANWRGVAAAARDRPHTRQRLILTSTRGIRLSQQPIDGHIVVPLTDILVARDVLAIDPNILDGRLGGVAPVANDRPIVLSPDGRQLVINGGEPIPFSSPRQIAAIRKLVDAYYAGKRLRASEISEHGSLERFFGAKKWKQLEPYLITRSGFWRFEPQLNFCRFFCRFLHRFSAAPWPIFPAVVRHIPREIEVAIRNLDQTELACRWSISPRTLERWRWVGQGPRYLKIGGRVVYRLEEVEAFEAQQTRDSTSQTSPTPALARSA